MARPRDGYKLADGTKVVGTTTAIKTLAESEGLIFWAWKQGKEGKDFRETKKKAGDIGTLTHDFIEAHLRNEPLPVTDALDIFGPDEGMFAQARRAYEAWLGWFDKAGITVESFERPLVSEIHRFGGTPDALGKRGDIVILPDWKTSKYIYPENIAQLGGYSILMKENAICHPTGALILRADKEKNMKWDVAEVNKKQLEDGERAFLAALRAYNERENLKDILQAVSR